ncbi:MAG: pilus assembly protein PilM [Patescibacteria group bacterium]|nr:pilus assembly protein PilM [Patescibacteria group bacterium]
MVTGWFNQLFPPPKFLAPNSIGLDISDRSLKYVQLKPSHRHFQVKAYGEQAIPVGIVESGQIKNQAALIAELQKLRQNLRERYLRVSLPEENAFILRLSLPYMNTKELRSSIGLQLSQHVPLQPENAVFDYEILRWAQEPGEHFELSVTVFPKVLLMGYHQVLTAAGFTPLAYEVEAQAIARSVINREDKETVMIIDFGKTRTSFFIASGGIILLTSTLGNVGGENLTQAIEKGLHLPHEEAERLKEKEGLVASQNQQLLFALMPTLSVLRDEINKIYSYWNSHRGEHQEVHQAINRVIVCGGQATLPGLVEYLSDSISAPVTLGNVWTNVLPIAKVIPPISFNQSQRYATSLGLALRSYHD